MRGTQGAAQSGKQRAALWESRRVLGTMVKGNEEKRSAGSEGHAGVYPGKQ